VFYGIPFVNIFITKPINTNYEKTNAINYFTSLFSLAQIDYNKEAKTDLKKLDSIFDTSIEKLDVARDSLKVLSEKLSPTLTEFYEEVKTIKKTTDSIYDVAKVSIAFYSQKGVVLDSINSFIQLPSDYEIDFNLKKEEKIDEQTYLLFGEKNLVLLDSIIKSPTASKVMGTAFNAESETYFGDFWFPMDKQKIKIKKEDAVTTLDFDRVTFEVHEGSISDIRVFLKDKKGNTRIFTNKTPISLLRFNKLSGINRLFHTSNQSNDDENYKGYTLLISDVLRYFYSVEGNYIPNDVKFDFPLLNNNEKTNKESSNKYVLRQSTALNNIIDLRAYTDVFGLADTFPNGIAQFEGRADFFVNPNNIRNTHVYFVKKIQPYVSYSRLEEEDQLLTPESLDNADGLQIKKPLNHLQKTYFDAGVKLDLISFKLHKSLPFEVSMYTAIRYQVSRLKLTDEENANYTVFGTGGGTEIEFKRFSNFALNYSIDFLNYRHGPYNDLDGIVDPNDFFVMRNEFEVSWYPVEKKNNAVFLRLRVFDNLESKNGSNFFQAQLGYKFTIGAGKIQANN